MAGFDYDEIVFRNGIYQPHTSELGGGRVRATFSKMYPNVTLDGRDLDVRVWSIFPYHLEDGSIYVDTDEGEYFATIADHQFQARHVGGNQLDMELIEPDGTIWQARGGYQVGERFLEDESPETFYLRLMSHRFHWTPA